MRSFSRSPHAKVSISVRGEVRAYVVGAQHLEALEARERGHARARARPPRIEASLESPGNLDEGSKEASLGSWWDAIASPSLGTTATFTTDWSSPAPGGSGCR